jgi:hypothetical protein
MTLCGIYKDRRAIDLSARIFFNWIQRGNRMIPVGLPLLDSLRDKENIGCSLAVHHTSKLQGLIVEPDLEAIAVFLEAECFVEAVRLFALQIAGEGQLVAVGLLAPLAGMLHHGAPYTPALMLRVDSHIFYDGRLSPTLGEIIHDEQFVGADRNLMEKRHEDVKGRILFEPGEMRTGLFGSKVPAIADPGGSV